MNKKKVKDHEGREFSTIKEMCEYWDIPYRTFLKRINNGCDLEYALTGVRKRRWK